MGIRVDAEALKSQLAIAGCEDRLELPFHKMLIDGEAALYHRWRHRSEPSLHAAARKAHVGEVQASIWDKKTEEICAEAGVSLL